MSNDPLNVTGLGKLVKLSMDLSPTTSTWSLTQNSGSTRSVSLAIMGRSIKSDFLKSLLRNSLSFKNNLEVNLFQTKILLLLF